MGNQALLGVLISGLLAQHPMNPIRAKTIKIIRPVLDNVVSAQVYLYNPGLERGAPSWCGQLIRDGVVCRNASRPLVLSSAQLKRLKELLRDRTLTTDLPPDAAACWNPHQGFTLFGESKARLIQVDVSLECNRIEFPMRNGPALTAQGEKQWRAFLTELKRAR